MQTNKAFQLGWIGEKYPNICAVLLLGFYIGRFIKVERCKEKTGYLNQYQFQVSNFGIYQSSGGMVSIYRKVALVLIILFLCVGCDQATKIGAVQYLEGNAPISLLGDSFRFQFAENTGAMYSIGAGFAEEYRFLVLVVGVGAFLMAVLVYVLVKPLHYISVLGISLFIGGGIGNLWDRMFNNGAVVDFMRIQIGPLETAIFNVADVVILAGTLVLLISSTFLEGDHTTKQELQRRFD